MCEGDGDLNQALYAPNGRCDSSVGDIQPGIHHRVLQLLITGESKLALTLAALVANLLAQTPFFPLILAGISVILLYCLGLRIKTIAKRLIVPSYLVVVAVMTQLFLTGHIPLVHLGPITLYQEGLLRGILIGGKIIGGTSVLILFSVAIRVPDGLAGHKQGMLGYPWWEQLAAGLHVPTILVEITVLTYRYLFLLAEEAERVRQAQVTRLGHRNPRASLKSFGTLIGMVVVRSFDRGERVHEAMLLRGYSRNISATAEMAKSDVSGFIAAAPIVLLLLWMGQTI